MRIPQTWTDESGRREPRSTAFGQALIRRRRSSFRLTTLTRPFLLKWCPRSLSIPGALRQNIRNRRFASISLFLSGRRESNSVILLPKQAYYRYTTPRSAVTKQVMTYRAPVLATLADLDNLRNILNLCYSIPPA